MSFSTLLQSITLMLAVLMFAACSNKASTFVAAPQDADKGSIIYVYRPSSSTNFMMSPQVVIDDSEKFKIGSGNYRYVYLQTGQHTVGLNPTDQYITEAAVTINVEAGQSYFLRVKTSLKFETDKMNTRKFWIDVVAEKDVIGFRGCRAIGQFGDHFGLHPGRIAACDHVFQSRGEEDIDI